MKWWSHICIQWSGGPTHEWEKWWVEQTLLYEINTSINWILTLISKIPINFKFEIFIRNLAKFRLNFNTNHQFSLYLHPHSTIPNAFFGRSLHRQRVIWVFSNCSLGDYLPWRPLPSCLAKRHLLRLARAWCTTSWTTPSPSPAGVVNLRALQHSGIIK